MRSYPIYKGLQRPLIFRGFKGKFIAWGIGSLLIGLILGGLIGAVFNMAVGGFVTVGCVITGLILTSNHQKKGLHSKTRHVGVFQFPTNLNRKYYDREKEKNGI